jgi:hypothetical protein
MRPAELSTERLFQTGEFQLVDNGYLYRKDGVRVFPNQFWFASPSKISVLVVFQSKQGVDFSLGADPFQLVLKLEQEGVRVRQAYVANCYGEGKRNGNPQLISFRTALQQKQKLNGYPPMQGEHGLFYWIDDDGFPPDAAGGNFSSAHGHTVIM